MSLFTADSYLQCPFCHHTPITSEHVRDCSLRDAQKKLSQTASSQDLSLNLWRIFSAKEFADAFDAASDEAKAMLWVCTSCYEYDTLSLCDGQRLPPECCTSCGRRTIELAKPFIQKLIEDA